MDIIKWGSWWISTDKNLGSTESSGSNEKQIENASAIRSGLRKFGWTDRAICAVLGNMQVEGYMNPAITETRISTLKNNREMWDYPKGKGLGLAQWTSGDKFSGDVNKLLYYAQNNNWYWYDGWTQVWRMQFQRVNNMQFGARTVNGVTYSWSNFPFNDTSSVEDMAEAWLRGYERPTDPEASKAKRRRNALWWYEHLPPLISVPAHPTIQGEDPPTPTASSLLWFYIKMHQKGRL